MTAPPYASHMVEVSSAAAAASHHSGWSTSVRHDMEIPSAHFSRASEAVSPPEHRPHWRASLDMIERHVPVTKRLIRAQDTLYTCGSPFETLHLINSGIFKIVSLASDGRERSADFVFDGDWLGFDGIPSGHHTCTAVALDIGEVWAVRYDSLMQAAAKDPSLLHQVLAAISAQLARNRDIALAPRLQRVGSRCRRAASACGIQGKMAPGDPAGACINSHPLRSTGLNCKLLPYR